MVLTRRARDIRFALTKPVDELCQDDRLLKSFYTWHRFQSRLPGDAANMSIEMRKIIATAAASVGVELVIQLNAPLNST